MVAGGLHFHRPTDVAHTLNRKEASRKEKWGQEKCEAYKSEWEGRGNLFQLFNGRVDDPDVDNDNIMLSVYKSQEPEDCVRQVVVNDVTLCLALFASDVTV